MHPFGAADRLRVLSDLRALARFLLQEVIISVFNKFGPALQTDYYSHRTYPTL